MAASGVTLEFATTATFANALVVEASKSVTFGAAAGKTAALTGAFTETTATLHFGSATDNGRIVLAPSALTASGVSVVEIDGGTLALGNANAAAMLGRATGGLNLGAGAHSRSQRSVDRHRVV